MNSKVDTFYRSCPICGFDRGRKLGVLSFAVFDDCPLPKSFNVVNCGKCGFVFYDMKATRDRFDDFYATQYFSSSYLSGSIPLWLEAKYKSIAGRINEILPQKNIPMYDIGCGTGGLLKQLANRGYTHLSGVDRNAECLKNIGKEFSAIEASAYDFTIADSTMPVALIYSEIFEHLLDPGCAIDKTLFPLCEKSIAYVTVPNSARYDKFGCSPLFFLLFEHINHFDAPHLEQLFNRHGFRLMECVEKDHDIGEERPFPMLHAVFERAQNAAHVTYAASRDMADRMEEWFSRTLPDLDNDGRLTKLSEEQRPVYVWGISYRTQMMLAMSPLRHCAIKAFIDNDERKQARTIAGHAIVGDSVLRDASISSSSAVVIGAGPSALKMKKELIENFGFKGEIILL